MRITNKILTLTAALFLAFGLYGFLRPELAPSLRLYTLAVAAPPAELRAYYGDFEIGFGLFLLLAAFRPAYHASAHLAAAFTLGIIAFGRVTWILRGSDPTPALLLSAGTEFLLAALNLRAFSRAKRLAPAPQQG